MATHALSQDLSGWSDKTVCRQLLNNPDNTDYLEEADSRSLDCASGTKNSTKNDTSTKTNNPATSSKKLLTEIKKSVDDDGILQLKEFHVLNAPHAINPVALCLLAL